MPVSQFQYRTAAGRSRPSCLRIASIWSGVAPSPRMATATSPGRRLTIVKISPETSNRIRTINPSRRSTSVPAFIAPDLTREPHRAHLEHVDLRRHESLDPFCSRREILVEVGDDTLAMSVDL